ncbi:hypothetical protein GCM10007863_45380 [Dyella mobilis]|nr:hypothetical protein GCM10007863_45380 [Dyella mobilis]
MMISRMMAVTMITISVGYHPQIPDAVRDRLDQMVAAMQTSQSKAACEWLFRAAPEDLGAAAMRGAKRKKR